MYVTTTTTRDLPRQPDPAEVHILAPIYGKWRRYRAQIKDDKDENVPDMRISPILVSTRPAIGDKIIMWGGDGTDANKTDTIFVLSGNITESEKVGLGWYGHFQKQIVNS